MAVKKTMIKDGNGKLVEVIDSTARTAIQQIANRISSGTINLFNQTTETIERLTDTDLSEYVKLDYLKSVIGNLATKAHTHVMSDVEDIPAIDTTATSNSTNLVTSGAAYKAGYDARQYTRTTNKAGTKLFITGGTSQATRSATYSNVNCYVGTDNCLYSNGQKTVTDNFSTTATGSANITIQSAGTWTDIKTATGYSGKYLVIADCMVASSASGRYMCRIMKNGTEVTDFGHRGGFDSSNGAWSSFHSMAYMELTASDTIAVQGYVSNAGTTIAVNIKTLKLA